MVISAAITTAETAAKNRAAILRDFYVYRRTDLPCRRCGTPVRTQEMVGRNLYWCPTDQAV